MFGVGPETTGQLLASAGDNPERIRSEAAFAHLAGVAPTPASSGRTHRHRLNRGTDQAAVERSRAYSPAPCRSGTGQWPTHRYTATPPPSATCR
ncbi:transposase [Kitasatospora sp. HPMI-4]|uniref:transposase n=1 Tax=Kitasatospora sp. HPMI-4 TaxID=3448443 RepID=UPI003F1CB7D4